MSSSGEPRPSVGLLFSGLIGLAMVAWRARGRLRGRYWRWRHETAFGPGSPEHRFWHLMAFGDWVRRMRRFR